MSTTTVTIQVQRWTGKAWVDHGVPTDHPTVAIDVLQGLIGTTLDRDRYLSLWHMLDTGRPTSREFHTPYLDARVVVG